MKMVTKRIASFEAEDILTARERLEKMVRDLRRDGYDITSFGISVTPGTAIKHVEDLSEEYPNLKHREKIYRQSNFLAEVHYKALINR